jgi:hypothetical protein
MTQKIMLVQAEPVWETTGSDSCLTQIAPAMSFENTLTPVGESDLPPDLYWAYLNARFYVNVPLTLIREIREWEPDAWIPSALRLADGIGRELKGRKEGRTALPPSLLVEFGGLGRPISEFGLHAPSTHEWAPMFARAVIEEIWVGMSRGKEKKGAGLTWGFYLMGSTENPLSTRDVGDTHTPLDRSLRANQDAIKEHVTSLEVPDEQLIYCNLKTEACMAAGRRPTGSQARVRFDDDALTVIIDGQRTTVAHPTPYLLLKTIALARPAVISSEDLCNTPGLRRKNISRELDKLPQILRSRIQSSAGAGYWFVLDSGKLS